LATRSRPLWVLTDMKVDRTRKTMSSMALHDVVNTFARA